MSWLYRIMQMANQRSNILGKSYSVVVGVARGRIHGTYSQDCCAS